MVVTHYSGVQGCHKGPLENVAGKQHAGQTKLQVPLFLHCKCSCGKLRLEKLKHRSPSSLLAPKGQRFTGALHASGSGCLEGNKGAENCENRDYKCFGLAIGKYLPEAHCVITVNNNVSFITS